ncbi:IS66 family insertion sequence element accessory protein TnpA [Brenneria uluponensis]|uniref:IS66 family insertion sequence element accessory protein TnpA n=1 Tax=Brenneria uluponensis TaxID=3057057 RepID=UPI0028EB0582|nr:hypothetical protein [Brenneria ulupoensis]
MTSHEKQQYWSQLFVQQAQSDLSITNFCKAHQINIGTYYYWKQKLSDHSSTLRIHPVRVQEYRDLSPHGVVILSLPSGLSVELPADLPAHHIQSWVNALLC